MKKNFILKFVLIGLITGFFFTSCTLEKRRFKSGYYVNWKSNQELASKDFSFSKDEVVLKKTKALETPDFTENLKTQKVNAPVLISFFKKNKNAKENIETQTKSYIQEHKHKFSLKQKGNKFKKITAFGNPEDPKINLLGLASLIFLLTGFLAILSIPMAIIAIRQFKKNPGKYKGIWAPVLALILPVILVAFLISLLITSSTFMPLAVIYIITLITIVGILHMSLY